MMTKSGKHTESVTRVADDRADRIVNDPFVNILTEDGLIPQEKMIEALLRELKKEPDLQGEAGYVDEICERCCDSHLQIVFQRHTKVVAKGGNSEHWYATVGTMTVRKLLKKETVTITKWGEPPSTHSVQILLTSDYVELGGPGKWCCRQQEDD